MRQSGVMGAGAGKRGEGACPVARRACGLAERRRSPPAGPLGGGASGPGTGVAYRLQPDDHGSSDRSEGAGQGGVWVPSEVDHRGGSPGAGTCAQRQVASGGFSGSRPARGGAVARPLTIGWARGSGGARRWPARVHLMFSG